MKLVVLQLIEPKSSLMRCLVWTWIGDDSVSQEELMHRVRQKFMEQEEQERLREEQSPKRKKSDKTFS